MTSVTPFSTAGIRGFLHRPAKANGAGLVVTHGAGADCDGPVVVAAAHAFCAAGLTVLRCDLPFRQQRPKGPPPRGSAAADANWGRIVAAIGRAGEKANRDKLTIGIGGVRITAKGEMVPGYDETPVTAHMKGRDIVIDIDVGVGRAKATVWTCDLTHAYIDINGSYRS